jgi:hypothetical protein
MTDEELLASITTSRDQVATLIEQITLKPKPNYEIDGQVVKWADYLETLMAQFKKFNEMIQDLGGPFEEHSNFYC